MYSQADADKGGLISLFNYLQDKRLKEIEYKKKTKKNLNDSILEKFGIKKQ